MLLKDMDILKASSSTKASFVKELANFSKTTKAEVKQYTKQEATSKVQGKLRALTSHHCRIASHEVQAPLQTIIQWDSAAPSSISYIRVLITC